MDEVAPNDVEQRGFLSLFPSTDLAEKPSVLVCCPGLMGTLLLQFAGFFGVFSRSVTEWLAVVVRTSTEGSLQVFPAFPATNVKRFWVIFRFNKNKVWGR